MSNHRRPAMPESMKRKTPRGTCRWCDKPIVKPDGTPNTRLNWHPACVKVYRVACFSADQRRAVFARDKGVCARCGVDSERARRITRQTVHLWEWFARRYYEDQCTAGTLRGVPLYEVGRLARDAVAQDVRRAGWVNPSSAIAAWQADHIRPLLEAEGRIEYFGLDNLQTLCHSCHVQKGREDRARQKTMKSNQPTLSLTQ